MSRDGRLRGNRERRGGGGIGGGGGRRRGIGGEGSRGGGEGEDGSVCCEGGGVPPLHGALSVLFCDLAPAVAGTGAWGGRRRGGQGI